jgi:hypothetical protein
MHSDFKSCPHYFFRRHVQGLVKPRSNVHLHFGACLAKGLETARREYCEHGDVSDAFHVASEMIIHAWGTFEPPPNPSRSESNKTLANCLLCLREYLATWPLDEDPMQIYRYEGKPCIEWSGAWPIPGSRHPETGEPVLYAGRFDMIGEFQRGVWGLDDKTTSVDPNNDMWRNQWRLRGQFTGYVWLAQRYKLPLRGFMVRGIAPLKESIRTGFALVPRPEWMVKRWLKQLQDDTASMCEQWYDMLDPNGIGKPRGHAFPQSFASACADFGGCTYLDLCASEHPDDWLGGYTVERWNPLAKDTL